MPQEREDPTQAGDCCPQSLPLPPKLEERFGMVVFNKERTDTAAHV